MMKGKTGCSMDQTKKAGSRVQDRKVLVADDEFLIRWSLTQALSQEGYNVTAVENGKMAIDALRSDHFDFIITDLVMPEAGGWDVLDFLRQKEEPTPVIMITAHGKEDTEKMAKENGAWAYVQKPFLIDRIKQILRDALSGGAGPNPDPFYSPS
jgi:DNA-binding NtrC family response regulator